MTDRHWRYLHGRNWKTPLTDVPLKTVGTARLKRVNYNGVYRHNGVLGYEFYSVRGWMKVTALQIKDGRRWKTWMVDDPVHWDGMKEAVEDLPAGRILVAGLGLGLMLHHMASEPRFTEITVIERDPDVIKLILPTLPKDPRVTIIAADYYRYIKTTTETYDGVLWDLAVGNPAETREDVMKGHIVTRALLGIEPRIFGLRKTPLPPDLLPLGTN